MKAGKVWLVGAGPGDPGLFTVKGREALLRAEVVVYDSLVGPGILSLIPPGAAAIFVGKRASCHTMPQEQINRILLEQAQKGLRVVRLKGGDPFLFGRGAEELVLLKEYQIPYEIVPGIPSPLAVPAYHGIPVTHRDFSSSLHVVTGHPKAGKEVSLDFEALVRVGGTLVFLMGVAALGAICRGLLEAGMEADMPAALLQQGTMAGQKRILATVGTLEEEGKRQGVKTPALIMVGKVCSLAKEFAWYESLPLSGYKVLLTRPRERISALAAKLREQGAEVLELPSIRTEAVEEIEPLRKVFGRLRKYQWIVFTSPTGVCIFFEKMREEHCDFRSLGSARIAALGEGTGKALEERGIFADLVPEVYDGEHLAKALAKQKISGTCILLPRAEYGNPELVRILEESGAHVEEVVTYRTVYEEQKWIDEKQELESGAIDCVVFTSASTVRGFAKACKGLDFSKVKAACIGKQTAAEAEKQGMQIRVAGKATLDSLAELVLDMKRKG